MKHPTFQTLPEILLYGLLVVVLSLNVFGLVISLQQQRTVAENSKIRTTQINNLQAHIDCIAKFFDQPNRQDIVISNLCKEN